jgi:hypothetical protein
MGIKHDIEIVGKDIGKVVKKPFIDVDHLAHVLKVMLTDAPAIKSELIQLITYSTALSVSIAEDITTSGLNATDDLKTLQQIMTLTNYLKQSVIPTLEKAFKDYKGK